MGPPRPAFPPRLDARRGPSAISPSDSAPLLLCSPRPSWPSREGTPALVPGPKDAPFVACHLCVIVLTWLQALPLCQISTATPGK